MKILSTKILTSKAPDFIDQIPFIEVRSTPIEKDLVVEESVIISSKNAVRSLAEQGAMDLLRDKHVFCVGPKTSAYLAQFNIIPEMTANSSEELAQSLKQRKENTAYTFFCGNLRRPELYNILTEEGIRIDERIVYSTHHSPKTISDQYDALMFFSPSAVISYLSANTIGDEICLCIGKTTASALPEYISPLIAKEPSEEATIELIKNITK